MFLCVRSDLIFRPALAKIKYTKTTCVCVCVCVFCSTESASSNGGQTEQVFKRVYYTFFFYRVQPFHQSRAALATANAFPPHGASCGLCSFEMFRSGLGVKLFRYTINSASSGCGLTVTSHVSRGRGPADSGITPLPPTSLPFLCRRVSYRTCSTWRHSPPALQTCQSFVLCCCVSDRGTSAALSSTYGTFCFCLFSSLRM